jgi:small subunit ribosomal protein S20
MANKSAAKKAIRTDAKKNAVNSARRSRIRTFIRKVNDAVQLGDETKSRVAFKDLEKEIMRGVTKKIIKLNTASRKLSRIAANIRKIKQQ